ncbi:MAG: hypothetical protein RLZZ546_1383, partial [Bacteroidota bacterium]
MYLNKSEIPIILGLYQYIQKKSESVSSADEVLQFYLNILKIDIDECSSYLYFGTFYE